MKKTFDEHRKELAALLIPYFESKPTKNWITGRFTDGRGHCAYGFIELDFHEKVRRTIGRMRISLISANDNVLLATRVSYIGNLPKERVLNYLNLIVEGKA